MHEGNTHQRLLIIDDDELIVSFLEDYLNDLGYDVTAVNSAEDAIQYLFSNTQFDIVLTDVNLPGKSGLDLLKIIHETRSELPVVVFTGRRSIDTAISALQFGAVDFITKPFDLKTVRAVIEKIVRKRNRSQMVGKIYQNLQNLKLVFEFTTIELEPGILAKEIASILLRMEFSDEDTIKQYELAFTECLVNGIDHGNLELPSNLKNNDLLNRSEYEELREERLKNPEFANRKIVVIFEGDSNFFSLTIKDDGRGFDWKNSLDVNHKIRETNMDSHGRGFMLIGRIIDEVYFNPDGNIITLVKHRPSKYAVKEEDKKM